MYEHFLFAQDDCDQSLLMANVIETELSSFIHGQNLKHYLITHLEGEDLR